VLNDRQYILSGLHYGMGGGLKKRLDSVDRAAEPDLG
jgi:hypothetical protein